ncbi:MAG TPA: FHA domain-containing serine/threonine-protein kinase [Anaerolineales bacterium]|nr:FHA domain-containing serine/threonine-protein kinase [Anaerolineales bacterium]
MPLTIGAKVGPYQIQELVGQGGMAAVYKAYHPALERHVAIKVMDVALSKEPDFLERFRREARVIAKLDNPHIVPLFDFDEFEGQPYIVLKFIDGPTLKDRIKNGTLSQAEILTIVEAVGDALDYAHSQGVLHRDTKPSNVLIAADGKVYLTDFGLAKIVENASNLTGDSIVGTPHYISPEQAVNAGELDTRTDIYSFGVMIYEMVVGQLPFDAKSGFSVIEDHIFKSPPAPTSIKPEISPEVESVILKALAKKPEERYQKVAEFVSAFKKAWLPASPVDVSSTTNESTVLASLLAENGKAYPIPHGSVVIGRSSTSNNIKSDIDLTEFDTKRIISRRHALIKRENNEYLLYDLESRNGTSINGERLTPNQPYTLVSGDVIEFGTDGVKLTFTR